MKWFKYYLTEAGGAIAGKIEIDKTSLEDAIQWVKEKEFDLNQLPDFSKNYITAQKSARLGKTKRKDMPVISDDDVKKLQSRLKSGRIDVHKPFSKNTSIKDPYPEGLSGKQAKAFLSNGIKDGDKKDDIVKVVNEKKTVKTLIPIQKQIYFDKSMGNIIDNGVENSKNFLSKSFFITSSDNYIIDGHHRFLSAMLVNPNMKVNTLSINLPINILLPVSLSYGDAIGNKRNA